MPRASLSSKIIARRAQGQRRRLPQGRRRLLRQPRHHASQRVMTDNGSCYRSKAFRDSLQASRPAATYAPGPIRRGLTAKPSASSRPRLREWAYAQRLSILQTNVPPSCRGWLHRYNWHRPHSSISSKPPISRLGLTENNLLRRATASAMFHVKQFLYRTVHARLFRKLLDAEHRPSTACSVRGQRSNRPE